MNQAIRVTPEQIAAAHRRRNRVAAQEARKAYRRAGRQPVTIASVAGYVAMAAFAAYWLAVALGWASGIDSWGWWA